MRDADRTAVARLAESITRWNHPTIRELGPDARAAIAELIAESVQHAYPSATPPSRIGQTVKDDGIAKLGLAITPEQASEVAAYFESRPCLNRHIENAKSGDDIRRDVNGSAKDFAFGCYTSEEIFSAPRLVELFTSDVVLDAVETFLGAWPMIFSVNTYWSFPQTTASRYGQEFHRDKSHPRFCVLFLYLTDTDVDGGPHQYFRGSHDPKRLAGLTGDQAIGLFNLPNDGYGLSNEYQEALGPYLETVIGKAGTAFLTDSYGLHRGLGPTKRRRLLAWARYSVFTSPPNISRLPLAILGDRYPVSERARYSLRALLE